jgi:hypothetical protein
MSEDDFRERSVREFLDKIDDPEVKEQLSSGFLETLKLDGYTERQIYEMKVKDAYDKMLEIAQNTIHLIDRNLQKLMKEKKE